MRQTFSGKVVWITGASSGIGEAVAKAFAAQGAKLVLSARREQELLRVRNEAGLKDDNSLILPLDLYHSEEIIPTIDKIKQKFGTIDILVCNAGISHRFNVNESTMEVNRQIMELNFFSVIALAKSVLPIMLEKKSGNIVVISSVMGKISLPGRSMYAASKHALHGFFDSLRAEVDKDNIGVTVVLPGYVKTNVSVNAVKGKGEKYGKMDEEQEKGISPEKCATGILKAVGKNKDEVFIGGKEIIGIWLNRFFPGLFRSLAKSIGAKRKHP